MQLFCSTLRLCPDKPYMKNKPDVPKELNSYQINISQGYFSQFNCSQNGQNYRHIIYFIFL